MYSAIEHFVNVALYKCCILLLLLLLLLSLVVVEEVECYMLPVSTPLTGNELVEYATVSHYL